MARALAITDQGEAPAVKELTAANPGPGQVTVRVRAASVNGIDVYVAGGYVWDSMPHTFPVVLGRDFAGVVEQVGADVMRLEVGNRVAAVITGMDLYRGAIAEELVVDAEDLSVIPPEVTFEQAAAVGLAGITARDLVDALALTPEDTVLVSGATGGVGVIAVQLAAQTGATVIATGRPGTENILRELGAAHVVDHTGDVAAQVRELVPDGVTAVAHGAGDVPTLGSLLAKDGRLASIAGATEEEVGSDDVTVTGVHAETSPQKFSALLGAVADSSLRVAVASTYPLDDANDALGAFGEPKVGKLVVTLG
jgi:NADPH:quinone reductase-like Zn-dependent oxidoreductase